MAGSSYGTLDQEAPSAAPVISESNSRLSLCRGVILAVAALACCAVVGIVVVRQNQPVALCSEIDCMVNTVKQKGAVQSEPRTLTEDEVEKLKEALKTEQGLEQMVRPPSLSR
eukprot:3675969-Rhodomonas_salina.1